MEKKSMITRISDGFCKVEKTVTWIAFAIMLALLLIQVICRYVFSMPLAWAEEMVRYTYIAVSFVGAIVAVRERSHIGIDIILSIIKKIAKNDAKKEQRLLDVPIPALVAVMAVTKIRLLFFTFSSSIRCVGILAIYRP